MMYTQSIKMVLTKGEWLDKSQISPYWRGNTHQNYICVEWSHYFPNTSLFVVFVSFTCWYMFLDWLECKLTQLKIGMQNKIHGQPSLSKQR